MTTRGDRVAVSTDTGERGALAEVLGLNSTGHLNWTRIIHDWDLQNVMSLTYNTLGNVVATGVLSTETDAGVFSLILDDNGTVIHSFHSKPVSAPAF